MYRNNKHITYGLHHYNHDAENGFVRAYGSDFEKIIFGYVLDGSFIPHNNCGPAIIDYRNNVVFQCEFCYHGKCVNLGENCDDGELEMLVTLKYGHFKYFTNGDGTRTYYE